MRTSKSHGHNDKGQFNDYLTIALLYMSKHSELGVESLQYQLKYSFPPDNTAFDWHNIPHRQAYFHLTMKDPPDPPHPSGANQLTRHRSKALHAPGV